MSYQIEPHTADVRLKVEAESYPRLIEESFHGLMALLDGKSAGQEKIREVSVEGKNKTILLIDFLNEVLALAQINKEHYVEIAIKTLTDERIEANLKGFPVSRFETDVKAVTYHEAEVKEEDGRWSVSLVLDV